MKGAIFIGFNGPPGVGKDTGADALMNMREIAPTRRSFAVELKELTCKFFSTPEFWFFYENMKDKPNNSFWGLTPRQAYIWMSEEVVKPKFGQDFWSKAALKYYIEHHKVFKDMDDRLYYPLLAADCGFNHEILPILEFFNPENVLIFCVSRRKCTFKNDSREWITHEGLNDKLGITNLVSISNNRSIKTYQDKVRSIVSEFIDNKRA